MRQFYLATPTKYEDLVIEDFGALGAVQLITDYTVSGFKKVDTIEKCERYVKLQQRITSVLTTLPPERAVKKSFAQALKASFSKPLQGETIVPDVSLGLIESQVLEVERKLDEQLGTLEKSRSELKGLKGIDQNLRILQKHGLRSDNVGDFENIFVRAGFMNRAFSVKLRRYAEGTTVKIVKWPDRREEDFVVVYGSNRDKQLMEEALTRLNFMPLAIPSGMIGDPAQALAQNREATEKVQQEIQAGEKEVRSICEGFQNRGAAFEPVVRRALNVEGARSAFSRTQTMSLVHGWIPAQQEGALSKAVAASTKGASFLKFENPDPSDQPPVKLGNRGVTSSFELFTKLRGTPLYGEIDPTPIITILFTIMYGMMFGDIGQGAVVLAIGLVFSRFQRGLLGIPARGMRKLGVILAVCGASSIFFGALYGEFFLSEAFHPFFVNPIQGQTTMIVVALLFGVAQLAMGLILKIINLLRAKARIAAAFGGVRLVYYAVGVLLAVKYASSLSLSVFAENIGLTTIAMVCLAILFFSPTIEGVLSHEFHFSESIMKGVSEFIEVFLSYLTNSISYVRLAAFAIAHSALGVAALILSGPMGFVAMNILALTIEALGVFIQCMRLTYYEFFTKFYSGGGIAYRPFSLPKILGTTK
jgi:V/A-type H+-transporting ATPase subunit I